MIKKYIYVTEDPQFNQHSYCLLLHFEAYKLGALAIVCNRIRVPDFFQLYRKHAVSSIRFIRRQMPVRQTDNEKKDTLKTNWAIRAALKTNKIYLYSWWAYSSSNSRKTGKTRIAVISFFTLNKQINHSCNL